MSVVRETSGTGRIVGNLASPTGILRPFNAGDSATGLILEKTALVPSNSNQSFRRGLSRESSPIGVAVLMRTASVIPHRRLLAV